MNLILLEENELIRETNSDRVTLDGRRSEHIRAVHRAKIGDVLRVGLVGGKIGSGTVSRIENDAVELEVRFNEEPPPAPDLILLLALPRPKFLTKVLQTATTFGVKRIYLFNSYRVDKIYWHCEQLSEAAIRETCLLGLEQARDTILPEVHLRRRFKPFVEDELPSLIKGRKALVAHPTGIKECPYGVKEPSVLAIGPEGGFIPYEVEKLASVGFEEVHLFPRILKVEAAVAALLGRLL